MIFVWRIDQERMVKMATNAQPDRQLFVLRGHSLGMIIMLAVQYILGIITNLYVQFPDTTNPGQLWEFAWTHFSEAAHIIFGLLLFISAVVLFVRALQYRRATWVIASSVGLISILAAIIGGVSFIPSQNDAYLLFMAISFIVAVVAYGWGIFVSSISRL